ncbi:MAG: septum formation protein Maf [Nitrospirae bacterium]|nr:MAG: septum formation protein Maf [Nitrospirota bacterium]
MRIILASTSPQRKALLALLHLPFDIVEPIWEEPTNRRGSPRALCAHHAVQKARSIAARFPHALVISGDTVIELDGLPLGKPHDIDEAREMLRQLNHRAHQVHTAVALVHKVRQIDVSFIETATVWMKPLTNDDIATYVATGESLGRAGSYCIQGEGAKLISRLAGDYTTVVGFPLWKLVDYLEDLGLEPPINLPALYHDRPYPNWDRF